MDGWPRASSRLFAPWCTAGGVEEADVAAVAVNGPRPYRVQRGGRVVRPVPGEGRRPPGDVRITMSCLHGFRRGAGRSVAVLLAWRVKTADVGRHSSIDAPRVAFAAYPRRDPCWFNGPLIHGARRAPYRGRGARQSLDSKTLRWGSTVSLGSLRDTRFLWGPSRPVYSTVRTQFSASPAKGGGYMGWSARCRTGLPAPDAGQK